jgi:adenosylcobinamide-GDP ribazoletransferase
MSFPRSPRGFLSDFSAATAFLTRIPVGTSTDGAWRLADAAWAFPLIGAGIGALAALTFFLAELLRLGSWPAGLLAVLTGLVVTGALHEDGLADTADGFFGAASREAKLAIMRDSRLGAFGGLALIMSILLRSAALADIGDVIHAGLALIAAHTAARAVLPAAMRALAPARSDGLGAAAGTPGTASVIAGAGIGVIIALMALGPSRGIVALVMMAVVVLAAAGLAHRQIGGYTGDVLGAFEQIGEIVMLLAASSR